MSVETCVAKANSRILRTLIIDMNAIKVPPFMLTLQREMLNEDVL